MTEIFIPLNVPSSKNSKQISYSRGKTIVNHSKTVKNYLKAFGIKHYSSSKKTVEKYKSIPYTFPEDEVREFLKDMPKPCILGFHFVRDSKRRADFHNIVQLPFDLFTAMDVIEDDDMTCIFPAPYERDGKLYTVDKEKPGVYLTILN